MIKIQENLHEIKTFHTGLFSCQVLKCVNVLWALDGSQWTCRPL